MPASLVRELGTFNFSVSHSLMNGALWNYILSVDQDTMHRIVKELGGEEIMPSLAERLIRIGVRSLILNFNL